MDYLHLRIWALALRSRLRPCTDEQATVADTLLCLIDSLPRVRSGDLRRSVEVTIEMLVGRLVAAGL
jgi:hypothetical protein